jgi:protein-S-isoprenylcysteine O-methyltransferase Ste14
MIFNVMEHNNLHINIKLVLAQVASMLIIYALPIFLPVGIHAWTAAWVFLGLWFGFWVLILVWLFRQNPELFQERMRLGTSDQAGWDRIIGPLVDVSLVIWLLITSYDAGRFHWSSVPVWLQVLGAMILIGAFYLYFLTFRENSYLSPLVRVQGDRGQKVISTGPYHLVRHPMYASTLVVIVGASLLLGSWYGILGGLVVAFALGWRIIIEENTLKKELSGYREYMLQVKYRLIPYIW